MTKNTDYLANKYREYYTPIGTYRRFLLQQESLNNAEMFDYFSNLQVRIKPLITCNELIVHRDSYVIVENAKKLAEDITSISKELFSTNDKHFERQYCALYDVAASIVEDMAIKASKYLSTIKTTTESADLIQRRTHLQKSRTPDIRRSNSAKQAWKKNRDQKKQAIQKFHKSSAGKKFHRNLTRFNNFRNTKTEQFELPKDDILITCKGLSSLMTSLIIEIQNYITANINEQSSVTNSDIEQLRETFHIFNELLATTFEAYFDDSPEVIANALEVITDFYKLANE